MLAGQTLTMPRKRKSQPAPAKKAVAKALKHKDANQPLDYPIIGVTISPYAKQYFNKSKQQKKA